MAYAHLAAALLVVPLRQAAIQVLASFAIQSVLTPKASTTWIQLLYMAKLNTLMI